jgi:hypothetical protein
MPSLSKVGTEGRETNEVMLTPQQWEIIKNIAAAIGGVSALFAVLSGLWKLWQKFLPDFRAWRDRQTLTQRLGAELYDAEEIRRATDLYIEPDCQSVDPSGSEDLRRVVSTREPLFAATDRLLENLGQYKFLILLADSGMGKTSFLLNYYAYHWRHRRKRRRFNLKLVPLNLPSADDWIKGIPEDQRNKTVLFLDALDEDRKAIADHRQRLGELLQISRGFRTLITCRSQFFPKDEEIPVETGVLKIGAVRPNESRAHYFHKLYLSPLTDHQVEIYLKRRFPSYSIASAAQLAKSRPRKL